MVNLFKYHIQNGDYMYKTKQFQEFYSAVSYSSLALHEYNIIYYFNFYAAQYEADGNWNILSYKIIYGIYFTIRRAIFHLDTRTVGLRTRLALVNYKDASSDINELGNT